jgi:hypothetical protein
VESIVENPINYMDTLEVQNIAAVRNFQEKKLSPLPSPRRPVFVVVVFLCRLFVGSSFISSGAAFLFFPCPLLIFSRRQSFFIECICNLREYFNFNEHGEFS